ncbi:MAG: glycosyltransferase [Bacteroidota bacterium]
MLFSVIIPTFNRGDRLKKTLDSLASQTFKDFEVLVCDDGSKDNTEDVVKAYRHKLDISYFWSENWGGPARPRNIGIQNSRGEWICFLDSDDWWRPDKLEKCIKFIEDYDVIYHCLAVQNERTNIVGKKKIGSEVAEDVLRDLIVNGNVVPNSGALVRKEILIKVGLVSENKKLISMEDYDLWLKVAFVTKKFKFIPEPLGIYNWNSDTNISKISDERISKEITIFQKYRSNLTERDFLEARAVLRYKLGRYYNLLGNRKLAFRYLRSSMLSHNARQKFKSLIFYIYYSLNRC